MDTPKSKGRMGKLRGRLYVVALALTVSYLIIGYLSSPNRSLTGVYLSLNAALILVLGLAAAETYLYILRLQGQRDELQAERAGEQEF